jgi:hypothetical protein
MNSAETLLTRLIEHLQLRLTPDNCGHLKILYLATDAGQLDCLGIIQAVGDFEEVKRHSIEFRLPAGTCRVLDLDALIRSKEAMNRPRDREAVLQLKAIRRRMEEHRPPADGM